MVYWINQLIAANEQLYDTNQMLSLYESQYTQLLDHIQETSRQRHDFRHQLTVISELLNHENYQGARILKRLQWTALPKLIRYTDSAAMNALLSHYANLCNAKEIHTDFKLQLCPKTCRSQILIFAHCWVTCWKTQSMAVPVPPLLYHPKSSSDSTASNCHTNR